MTNHHSCAACGRDMKGKWAGQRWGKRVLCMACNNAGWNLTEYGVRPPLVTWYAEEMEFWCAYDGEYSAIGYSTEREARRALMEHREREHAQRRETQRGEPFTVEVGALEY